MKGRVGRSITICLLVTTAALLLLTAGCQRAKPARSVAPPPATPRVETPVIARVAVETATAVAGSSPAYPAPAEPRPGTPVAAASAAAAQDAYPPAAPAPTPAAATLTVAPSAEPSPMPTEAPTAVPTATVEPEVVSPTPQSVPPTPVPEIAYRVKAGDSVGSIAVLFNTTTAAILARNDLSDPSLIRVGQTLIIPAPSPETIPTGSSVQHMVQAGETLDVIAGYYRTTAAAVLAQNPALSDPENLAEGTVLTVIAGSEAAARTHVVKAGESLSLIAESYGLTTQALARANGLTDPSRIRVGQTLIIP